MNNLVNSNINLTGNQLKFQSEIYQTMLKNKLIFLNFSIEKLQSDNKIDQLLLKLNKTEQDFKNVTDLANNPEFL